MKIATVRAGGEEGGGGGEGGDGGGEGGADDAQPTDTSSTAMSPVYDEPRTPSKRGPKAPVPEPSGHILDLQDLVSCSLGRSIKNNLYT